MKLDTWLSGLYDEELSKVANLEGEFENMEPEEILKIALGQEEMTQALSKKAGAEPSPAPAPTPRAPVTKDVEKVAMERLAFVGQIARQLAHVHSDMEKQAKESILSRAGEAFDKATIPAKGQKNKKGKTTLLTRANRFAQGIAENKGFHQTLGALSGAGTGSGIGRLYGGNKGRLIGAGLGALAGVGVGRLTANFARRYREDIKGMDDKAKWHGQPKNKMTKEDEFTSPEAKSKAEVMMGALKASKGAPTSVRKGAIRYAASKVQKIG